MLLFAYYGERVAAVHGHLVLGSLSAAWTTLISAPDFNLPVSSAMRYVMHTITSREGTPTGIAFGVSPPYPPDIDPPVGTPGEAPEESHDGNGADYQRRPRGAQPDGLRYPADQLVDEIHPTAPPYPDGWEGVCDLRMSLKLLGKALGLPKDIRITRIDQNEVEQRTGSCSITVVGPVDGDNVRLRVVGIGAAIPQHDIKFHRPDIVGALDPELHSTFFPIRGVRQFTPGRGWHYQDEPGERPRERPVQLT